MAALSSQPKRIFRVTSTLVGGTMLNLAKYYMYQSQYGIMRTSLECRLLNSDKSLLYRDNSEDFHYDLKVSNCRDQFDFSGYAKDHDLYREEKNLVFLKFKDEFAGVYMQKSKL